VVDETLPRIESCYDGIARAQARVERHGPLVLFVKEGPGWPLYARPAPPGDQPVTVEDIARVRARQRELGVPEEFEWVHDLAPDLLPVAERAGLSVLRAPLLVLDPAALPPPASDVVVRLLDPGSPAYPDDFAASRAVGAVGFGNPGTAAGPAGPAERDTAGKPDDDLVRAEAARAASGAVTRAVVDSADGVVATGALLRSGDAAEIVGVTTLPSVRRRGLGAAVSATLARHALDHGVRTVYLSAGSEEIARVYQRVGFRRVGTACIAEPAGGHS
jgi:N-acetylglutamate synthase-like GNAT family acetyltransferase